MHSLADTQPAIALGALDGRYRGAVAPLVDHLSEAALNRMRVHVEVEWLIHLTDAGILDGVRALDDGEKEALRDVVEEFDGDDIAELAEIERETVHDVKAVEYYLKRRLTQIVADAGHDDAEQLSELIHFCCTSEDINNLSYALMVQRATQQVWLPKATTLVEQVATMARDMRDVPLLAHTHGQPATPTTMGKEFAVLAHRLGRQLRRIEAQEFLGKLNGATGTVGAHTAAVPGAMAKDLEANWEVLGEPIQTAMRALGAQGVPGMEQPYERLKELTRGRRITGDDLREFVRGLGLPADVEARFVEMTPATYVGIAPQLVDFLEV